jgi:hypothetical protein
VPERWIGSVVIPAHNEESVIGRCLGALTEGTAPGTLDVVVVCNGCTDDTARVARSVAAFVTVVEIREPSKVRALTVGDATAGGFPRLYLDADVVLPGVSAVAVLRELTRDGVLAARAPVSYDTARCSPLVRRYYAARALVPGLLCRLWGAGVYGLSEQGRARFGAWPDHVADDLFVDSLFTDEEIVIVETAPVVVSPPRTPQSLLAVLRRGARAKAPRARTPQDVTEPLPLRQRLPDTLQGLLSAAGHHPSALLDVLVYAGFAVGGRLRRPGAPATGWERDQSSREVA